MCRVDRAGTGNRRWGRASRVVGPSGSASLPRPKRGVQHLRRPERPTRREGERGTHRWCPLCVHPASGRCRCDSLAVLGRLALRQGQSPRGALLGNYRAVPRAVVALPHCPEDGSGPRSTRLDIGEQKRDNPRRSPAYREGENMTNPRVLEPFDRELPRGATTLFDRSCLALAAAGS